MADIPVERRTGNWWKWLLGLLVLALIVWLALSLLDGGEGEMGTPPADDEPIEQQDVQPNDQQQEPGEQSEAQSPVEDTETAGIGLVLTDVAAPVYERNAVGRAVPVHRR